MYRVQYSRTEGLTFTRVYLGARLVLELVSACRIPKAEAIAEARKVGL